MYFVVFCIILKNQKKNCITLPNPLPILLPFSYSHRVQLQCFSDQSDIAESDNVVFETSLSLTDILPINPKNYDKNRAPKVQGQPTIVYFHVTVLSLDSINEESMVNLQINVTFNVNYISYRLFIPLYTYDAPLSSA